MFEEVVDDGSAPAVSVLEPRLLAALAELESLPAITTTRLVPPFVMVLDYDARRAHAPAPLDPQARLLEDGAGHLDAAADLDAVMSRAAAAQARELAAFA